MDCLREDKGNFSKKSKSEEIFPFTRTWFKTKFRSIAVRKTYECTGVTCLWRPLVTVEEQRDVRFAKGTRKGWLQKRDLHPPQTKSMPSAEGYVNTWSLQDEVPEKVKPKFNRTRRHGERTQ